MTGTDWVEVRLTNFGEEHAAGGDLRVQEGSGFVFRVDQTVRVTRAFDWERVLKPWCINGHALFEMVDAPGMSAGVEVDLPEGGESK